MERQTRFLFYILAWCTLILSSCSRDEAPREPRTTFKFTINGTAVEWNERGSGTDACIVCGPRILKYPTHFELISTAPQDYGEVILFTIKATALNVGTYSDTITTAIIDYHLSPDQRGIHRFDARNPSIQAAATQVGDYARVTFTSIKDGTYYDGTFRARLTSAPYGPDEPKVEIEGEFKNIKGVY
jgi:hypothetical protein